MMIVYYVWNACDCVCVGLADVQFHDDSTHTYTRRKFFYKKKNNRSYHLPMWRLENMFNEHMHTIGNYQLFTLFGILPQTYLRTSNILFVMNHTYLYKSYADYSFKICSLITDCDYISIDIGIAYECRGIYFRWYCRLLFFSLISVTKKKLSLIWPSIQYPFICRSLNGQNDDFLHGRESSLHKWI